MLVSSFNLLQSLNYTPYLFYKKLFKTEIRPSFTYKSAISYCGVGEWRICARLPHLGTGGSREHERRQPAQRVGHARRW
jgi:hypothetical protein